MELSLVNAGPLALSFQRLSPHRENMDPGEPETPLSIAKEKKVLAWQGGILIAMFVLFIPFGLLFTKLFNGSIKYQFLPLAVPLFFIGLSSIIDRVSILRIRGHKEPTRGKDAVILGALMILIMVVELSVIFIPSLSFRFFRFTGFNPAPSPGQLPGLRATGSDLPLHHLQKDPSLSELNLYTGISAWGGSQAVPISLRGGRLFLAGEIGSSRGHVNLNLISADALTGEILWQTLAGSTFIAVDPTHLYAQLPQEPFGGAVGVAAYDIFSGALVWERTFDWNYALGIGSMGIMDDGLNVGTYNHSQTAFYVIEPQTGEVSIHVTNPDPPIIFMIEDGTEYRWSEGLLAATGDRDWQTPIPFQYPQRDLDLAAPVVLDDLIILKNGHRSNSSLTAIRKSDGAILWTYDQTVVSNVAISGSTTFFITEAAQLVVLDTKIGTVLASGAFDPGFRDDFDFVNNSILVAADQDLVAIYFQDSQQLSIIRYRAP